MNLKEIIIIIVALIFAGIIFTNGRNRISFHHRNSHVQGETVGDKIRNGWHRHID